MTLHSIQKAVHVAKDKRNDFGGYNYRTAEGILAALKAALPDGWSVILDDTIQEVAGQIFVTAEANLYNGTDIVATACGHAMHPLTKKGMDPSQITGAASSYARKYALAGLLALDDGSVDPDATNKHDNKQGEALADAFEQSVLDNLPEDPSPETLAEAYCDAIGAHANGYKSEKGLNGYLAKQRKYIDFAAEHAPEAHAKLKTAVTAMREQLKEAA